MTITAGTPVVFENSNVAYISVAMLSSTLAIVCYRDYGNSYYGTACCLSISGTTITVGEQAVFESASTTDISVAMLTSTKAIVCYSDSVNLGYGTACCLSVSGTTITAGTPAVFSSSGSYVFSVGMLTSTLAIACYTDDDNSGYGTACCLSVSGTTITAGTPVVFENASSDYISVAILSSTLAIVCYRDGGNSSHGTACCLSVSGTTITAGTPTVFYNANTAYISVAMLSPSLAIVCYKDGGSTNSYGTARCLSISGTTITSRTPVVFESAYTDNISVGMLTSTKAIACYKDGGNSNHGTANIMTIS
jgi:hypothetical protein